MSITTTSAPALATTELRLCRLGEAAPPVSVSFPQRDLLPGTLELRARVIADRLEDSEADLGAHCLRDHQRFRHQAAEVVEHPATRDGAAGTHLHGCLQGPASGEHPEPTQQNLLRLAEEVVTPFDGREQRLMPRDRRAAALRQQLEPVVEARGNLDRGEDAHTRGGELDGQGDAVQPRADLTNGGRQRSQGRGGEPGPFDEQAHRVRLGDRLDRSALGQVGNGESRHQPYHLAGDAQGFSAGGHDSQSRAGAQQRVDQLGARGDHVLAVVQYQEDGLGAQVLSEDLGRRLESLLAQGERSGHRTRHHRGVDQLGQLDEPGPVPMLGTRPRRDLEGQSRLAHSGGAGERDQAAGGELFAQLRDLPVAADEAADRYRQVVCGPPADDGDVRVLGRRRAHRPTLPCSKIPCPGVNRQSGS
jgi:hypothetical protein